MCVNTMGNYTCHCNEGYEGDGFTCNGMIIMIFWIIIMFWAFPDINECDKESNCLNAECMNINGSYICNPCHPGFLKNHTLSLQSSCGMLIYMTSTYIAS